MCESKLQRLSPFSAAYWKEAFDNLKNPRMLALAAMVVALRAVCKLFEVPLGPNLNLNVAQIFNSLGAMVYGPVVGLVGAMLSDPLGYLLHPTGPYFPPYMLLDMSSSFLYALFFWKRPLSVPRVLSAKFTINLTSNIILGSLIYKWYLMVFSGAEAAGAYNLITLVRVVKNLVLFPLEAMLLIVVLGAATPALHSLKLIGSGERLRPKAKHYVLIGVLTLLSVALVLFYIFFLKDWVSANNIKWF